MERTLYKTGGVACSALVLLAVSVSTALAQLPTGTILGTVRDSTGAVIPGSTVTMRNAETGLTRTQKSEANGSYRLVALPAGTYEVRAEQTGFQTAVRSNLGLAVGQEAVVNFSLQVGAITQTVEVTGEAPLVNTTSGSLGTLVNEQQVSDLPLNGRNYVDLTLLQPGVVKNEKRSPSLGNPGTWFSVNGAPVRSNSFLLDGAPITASQGGGSASVASNTLGVEGIREWRVVTNSFSAEYGMKMGGQVAIVSKGGTNTFHGSLFEYFRNSALDARNFFDYKTEAATRRLPPFRRNQFGGSAGGPIKQDKLFFFATYELLRERLGETIITNTIGAGCHGPAGATITNVACPQLGTTAASVTVAPVTAPLLALYPLPNLPGNRVTFPATRQIDEHFGQIRGDYNFSDTGSAFVRYTVNDGFITEPLAFSVHKRFGTSRSHFLTASESHTFSSAMVGTFRFSFSQPGVRDDTATDVPVGPQYSFVRGQTVGSISGISGVETFEPDLRTPSWKQGDVFTYSADLFYTKGRHSLKFGTLVNDNRPASFAPGTNTRGGLTFDSLASFLQGQVRSYSALMPGSITFKEYDFTTWGFYLQDDLRVRSNLTLNLGLRYEFHTDYTERHGRSSSLRDIQRDAEFTVGKAFLNPSLKNFSPRFGFAWDVKGDGKTAVRGGFGVLYDIDPWAAQLNGMAGGQTPWGAGGSVDTTDVRFRGRGFENLTLPLVFPPEAVGQGGETLDYRTRRPHLLSYNFTVERQLPFQTVLSLGYAGSRGLNLISSKTANHRPPTIQSDGRFFWSGNEPRINPLREGITLTAATQNSWYNSLQFVVRKQLSKGLQFQSAYTWSRLMDEKPGTSNQDGGGSGRISMGSAYLPRQLDYGRADYDVTQAWRFNAIYRLPEMPLQGFLGKVLNGWWTSGILTAQTGLPFTVQMGGRDHSRSLGVVNRPDQNDGRKNSNIVSGTSTCLAPDFRAGQKLGTPDLYFDPCAFSVGPIGYLGTAGKNVLLAPGVANLNFSLVKDTRLGFLGEGGNLEFRTEIFNIFNRANFSRPSAERIFSAPSQTAAASAGTISSTDTKSREIQFALKIIW